MRAALRQTRRRLAHSEYTTLPAFSSCPASRLRTPAAVTPPTSRRIEHIPSSKTFSTCRRLRQETAATVTSDAPSASQVPDEESPPLSSPFKRSLPRTCPGCGAPTQIYTKDEAGYYSISRNVVKKYLEYDASNKQREKLTTKKEDDIYSQALKRVDPKLLEEIGFEREALDASDQAKVSAPETPVCDRCHNLIHHHVGVPIFHPSVEAIQQTIAESPHRRNHIYHVIDAADFPLSLIPTLQSSLRIPKLRTQNRRAKHKGWVANDRIAEVSFIITRADLLAPKKEQVDVLMPYMRDVLRDALGRANKLARLGNVKLVSAKRGWWTKQVKEDIWERGGAGWMVGKVNVGKSNLFEVVFPKGRGADYQEIRKIRSAAEREAMLDAARSLEELSKIQDQLAEEDEEVERHNKALAAEKSESEKKKDQKKENEENEEEEEEDFDPDALLPPPQPYTPYPILPIASSLPGTTASPIRLPFGRNKGELIDLPGLARTTPGLETFVQPAHHSDLVMTSRINSQRHVVKPGQSLLLGGGLVRITPKTPDDNIFLAYTFVPLTPHITRTDKAIDVQAQSADRRNVPSILAPSAGEKIRSAGTFKLKWDVTKKLAGPLTSTVAGKMRPENLPFRIFSTDILIEGVGWIEVSAQIRRPQGWRAPGMVKKDPNAAQKAKMLERERAAEVREKKYQAKLRGDEYVTEKGEGGDGVDDVCGDRVDEETVADVLEFPEVEVFTPLGKFVGSRRPMCASVVSGPKHVPSRERSARPRRSMKSVKMERKPMERT